MSREWTPEQTCAIEGRGGSLLVSAAAGSGKTAVLVERVIRRVLDDRPPVDLDRLLVATFSKASAAEMRRRVGEGIRQRLRQSPQDQRLLRQQMLLATAHISTIHSFCYELVRQNFSRLGLAHDVRLADDQEMSLLRQRALQNVLARRYASDDGSGFLDLVEMISNSRSDRGVEQTVESLYDFVRSHPFYEEWLDEKKKLYDPAVPVEQSDWGKIILEYAAEGLDYARTSLRQCLDGMDEAMAAAYGDTFKNDLDGIAALGRLAHEGRWDDLCRALDGFAFGRLGALRGYADENRKTYVQRCRSTVKDLVAELKEKRFCATAAQHADDMAFLAPRVGALFDTVLDFDRELTAAKLERHVLDYSDLEHLSLALLARRGGGRVEKTELAQQLSDQLDEILVDEYQDTNSVQEMLFVLLSRDQTNLFFVGDVKQSIYRFRLAMPELFIRRRQNSAPYDGRHFPACVVLGKNFRSRSDVTQTVNFFFSMLMSPRVGEIDYDASEALVCAAQYPPDPGRLCRTEFHLLNCGQSETPPRALEAGYAARCIRGLLESRMEVGTDDQRHAIRPGDICILLRSVKDRAAQYAEALAQEGVPAWTNLDSGFLVTEEVEAVVSLLQAVDNPLLDLPLAQAMASPIFAMTADDLAAARSAVPRGPLYHAVVQRAQDGDPGCRRFLEVLEDLRRHAAWESADRVILRLYDQTNFLRVAQVMPGGRLRRNNLLLLADYARDYSGRGFRGLSGFLGFIARLRQQGKDLPPAAAPGADAVTISSIHSSKGLEYPVVLVADLDKNFNRQDLSGNTLVHSHLGFACKRRDPQKLIQYTTVPLEAARLEAEREQLSEEMRVLYVAMTRAKEKLVLLAALSHPDAALAALQTPLENGVLSPWAVRQARRYFDWLAAALLHHTDGQQLLDRAGAVSEPAEEFGSSFEVKVVDCTTDAAVQPPRPAFWLAPPNPQQIDAFERSAAFVYPHEAAVQTPSKFAVSQLAHRESDDLFCSARPAFLDQGGLTAAQKGSATHKFMQFADYDRAGADLEGELARLEQQKFLSPQEAASVDRRAVETFFASPLARRMRGADRVLRELRFMGELSPAQLAAYTDLPRGDEPVVLQGIADCVLLESDGAVVVDYKTDRVKTPDALVQRYTAQLELYARLLRTTLQMPIKECWLYSFALGRAIRLQIPAQN